MGVALSGAVPRVGVGIGGVKKIRHHACGDNCSGGRARGEAGWSPKCGG